MDLSAKGNDRFVRAALPLLGTFCIFNPLKLCDNNKSLFGCSDASFHVSYALMLGCFIRMTRVFYA
ncbi:hypothetical protein J3E69DRAFT_334808, partial [Trichoderma sp. SZMC 28015]